MGDLSKQQMVTAEDADENGYCLDCGTATVHKAECVCTWV